MDFPSPVSIVMLSDDPLSCSVNESNQPSHLDSKGLEISMSKPKRISHPKFPTLDDILGDRAPHPYSYANFVGYLSQNHCSETVEFTNDVSRYTEKYNSGSSSKAELRQMWRRIIDAYIRNDGPKELNLPCDIRKQISSLSSTLKNNSDCKSLCKSSSSSANSANVDEPPSPEKLQTAVELVKEMMKENVYLPFIASVKCHNYSTSHHYHHYSHSKPHPHSDVASSLCSISAKNHDFFESNCPMNFPPPPSSISSQASKTTTSNTTTTNNLPQPSTSQSSWQQPSSWAIPQPIHTTTGTLLTKSSSSDSLFSGDETAHFNRGGPMTPPDSPHDYTVDASSREYPRTRSYSSAECMGSSSMDTKSGSSTFNTHSTFSQYTAEHSHNQPSQTHDHSTMSPSTANNPGNSSTSGGQYRNHWRKMSKRLKWGRRQSDKDTKLDAKVTASLTSTRTSGSLGN